MHVRAQPRRSAKRAVEVSVRTAERSAEQSLLLSGGTPEEVLAAADALGLDRLMQAAAAVRDARGGPVTFSPKVFIPLTKLCRDACGYCTFAQPPAPGRRAYMTLEEVLEVVRVGAALGCTEALFTLGDKPELAYPQAAQELKAMGFATTVEYVAAAAGAVLRETGLLPHVNAGVMARAELRALRAVSASQGLMLESTSAGLAAPGGPHHACPDKAPAARLATIEAAGLEGVPFTTGLLVGLGESRGDRAEALLAIRELHRRHGHIQELIIQNFRAKRGTAMAAAPEPPLEELLWTVAVARLLFGPSMSIQAPPNLTPEPDDSGGSSGAGAGWARLLAAGINDWGGISPLTRDYVSPERPWPHVAQLAAATSAAGHVLLPRLPVYPAFAQQWERWLDARQGAASPAAAVLRHMDAEGLARGSTWFAGAAPSSSEEEEPAPAASSSGNSSSGGSSTGQQEEPQPGAEAAVPSGTEASTSDRDRAAQPQRRSLAPVRPRAGRAWSVRVGKDGLLDGCAAPGQPSPRLQALLAAVLEDGLELSEQEVAWLFSARGADFRAVCDAADGLRRRVCGGTVSFVVNRNINYTNVCTFSCQFCAFSKGKAAEALRGRPYLLPLSEIARRTAEAWDRGATEVCMQGGIHPDFTGETYLAILGAAKAAAPDIHVHAFSPLEVAHGAASLGWPLQRYLAALRDAGLGSLPGTAAEVLDDGVRTALCPDKLSSREWLEVVEAAHSVGLPTTSTIMFGHVDSPATWAAHLGTLRALAARTGSVTEFVPLPFVHMESPIFLKGRARRGPTLRECFLMHAIARLALHPHITNIQASWVKMGPDQAAALLAAGCNDMGGSLMNESITRAAGAAHGQELPPAAMRRLIEAAGCVPRQRTTLYGATPAERAALALAPPPLLPVAHATAPPPARALAEGP